MPFEELFHTADLSIHVWAKDLNGLFVEAARGMNAITGAKLSGNPRVRRSYKTFAEDAESLMVSFLSELVYYGEQDRLVFDQFEIQVDRQSLLVKMIGAPLVSNSRTIKAVTYHNLQILQTKRGFEMEIVFDV
jgi:SHS2 domain-containing protein